MKRNFLISIAIIVSSFVNVYSQDTYDTILDNIEKALNAEDWQKADSLTLMLLRMDPGNPSNSLLLSNLGMYRFYSGNDSLAIDALDKACAMAPNSVTILANRARVRTAINEIQGAIEDYSHIIEVDSTYSDAYLHRGVIYLHSGEFEAAYTDFMQLLKLNPESEETNIALTSYYIITEQPSEALPYLSWLIKENPTAEYYAMRAMANIRLDKLMDAADDIFEGIILDAEYSELYVARALLNKRRYEEAAARKDIEKAIALGADPIRLSLILK